MSSRIGRITILAALLLLILGVSAVHAAPPAAPPPFVPCTSPPALGPHLEYLEDPGGSWLLARVTSPPLNQRFKPLSARVANFGLTRSAYWLRFNLDPCPLGRTKRPRNLILRLSRPPVIDTELYIQTDGPGSKWLRLHPGLDSSPGSGQGDAGVMAFRLPPDQGRARMVYLRVQSHYTSLFLPLDLYAIDEYISIVSTQRTWYGVYFGLCLGIVVLNLILFAFLRNTIYLLYSLNVSSWAIFFVETNGLLGGFLAANTGSFAMAAEIAHRFSIAALGLGITFAVLFTRSFLISRRHFPWGDLALRVIAGLAVIMVLLSPAAGHFFLNHFASWLGTAVSVVIMAVALVCWRRGFRPARFFVLAWTLFTIGGLIFSLTFDGVLPANEFTLNVFQAGSALDALLLCLALADRIRSLGQERRLWERRQQRYKRLSETDVLTRLYNRRYFDAALREKVNQAQLFGGTLSLLLMDVDNFKDYNDTYGHPEGDMVLMSLGRVINHHIREFDVACRYGGEEFAVILADIGPETSLEVAKRIAGTFSKVDFSPRPGVAAKVTVSVGVAHLRPREDAKDLVARADRALYAAKRAGKDRVAVDDLQQGPPQEIEA